MARGGRRVELNDELSRGLRSARELLAEAGLPVAEDVDRVLALVELELARGVAVDDGEERAE